MTDSGSELPAGAGPDAIYAAGLTAGEFKIQKCGSCGKHVFYPRQLCTHCGSSDLGWVAASGKGTVHATSVVRQRPEAGDHYNIALVDLDEGPRMMSRVVDIPADQVKIGDEVTAFIGEIDGEQVILFRPAGGGA